MIIELPYDSDFSIHNFPFGIAKSESGDVFAASRIGDWVINLAVLNAHGCFGDELLRHQEVFDAPYLNDFISLGKNNTNAVRNRLVSMFSLKSPGVVEVNAEISEALHPAKAVSMLMPVKVGDYTDFYSSLEHATNVGMMFRDPANALLPNWKHLPVAYHGRASSIVVSGTPVNRPTGQTKPDNVSTPLFGPTKQLDFELEMAFVVGKPTRLGQRVPVSKAEDYIFGMVIFNDLSARDIQKWEYVPLGPFLSKNFASVISPWVVTLEALEPFRVRGPEQDVEVLPYLQLHGNRAFDIELEVLLQPQGHDAYSICKSNFRYLYWNMCQQLAHHTVNGCNLNVGDMCASGTISGPDPGSYGSMLELAWRGTRPLELTCDVSRTFIEDYDTIIMRAFAQRSGMRVGFGESVVQILPATPFS